MKITARSDKDYGKPDFLKDIKQYSDWKKDKFDEFEGFPEQFTTSEDFFLSSKYDVKKFRIINHYYGQDSRRFKKMGYFGMAWYMIKNFINLKNPSYWKKTIHNKYWS
jgi:hypothetical protein